MYRRRQHAPSTASAAGPQPSRLLMTDLPQATALCRYFDRHGTPNERMLAHYLLGRTYADLGEAPQALEEYHAAAECADTLNIDSMGAHHLSRVYGQMGELFYKQELYHNALQSISLADHYASMCKETLIATNYYSQLAKCYYHLEKIDSAIYVSEQAARRFYGQKDTLSGNTCLGLVAYHCLRSGDLEKGKDCLVKYEKHSYLSEEAMKYNESWRLLYVYKGLFFKNQAKVILPCTITTRRCKRVQTQVIEPWHIVDYMKLMQL